jgi:hypothetical protein
MMLAGAGAFTALPWILGWPVARRLIAAWSSALLSPGSLEFEAIQLSWFRPTEIDGVVLRDAQGDRILVAPRAIFRWNLGQILFSRPSSATLIFPQGDLDIERLPDGTVDLYETLAPIIGQEPRRRLSIVIERGRLRFRDPAIPEPVLADETEIRLDIGAHPQPVTWSIKLARTSDSRGTSRLELSGDVRPAEVDPSGRQDGSFALKASHWPWTAAASGVHSRGLVDGTIDARRRSGRLTLAGALTVTDLEAAGDRLATEPVHLDTIRASLTVDGSEGAWTMRPLVVTARLGSLPGGGSRTSGLLRNATFEGTDVRLLMDARYESVQDHLEISRIAMEAPQYGQVDGKGTIGSLSASPRIELAGSIRPDWSALNSLLAREVEPNARVAGQASQWRLAGTIRDQTADRLTALRAEFGIQLDVLDVFGMRLGPTAVVLRASNNGLGFDPIDTMLNGGALHLEPEWVRDDGGRLWLKLGSSSSLQGATVNDEVSHRVLSYVAPVLDGATRVQGRVSVNRLEAAIPIFASSQISARVQGEMLFDNVRFLPGPLADGLIELLPPGPTPMLVLRDPVSVRISDRKVDQRGLVVPIGDVAAIGLEGSVDFDKKLDLVARFTMTPQGHDRPVLAALLRSARIEIPIGGTLEKPKIDRGALKQRLNSMGESLLEGSITAGAEGLLRLLQKRSMQPPEDRSPQREPLTPQQRRARRQQQRLERLQKKAERKLDGP